MPVTKFELQHQSLPVILKDTMLVMHKEIKLQFTGREAIVITGSICTLLIGSNVTPEALR